MRRFQILGQNNFLTNFWIPKLWFFIFQVQEGRNEHVKVFRCSFIPRFSGKFCFCSMWTFSKKFLRVSFNAFWCEKRPFENFLRLESKKHKLDSRNSSNWKTNNIFEFLIKFYPYLQVFISLLYFTKEWHEKNSKNTILVFEPQKTCRTCRIHEISLLDAH